MSSRAVPDSKPIRLLCVEDNPDDVELMGLALERADPLREYELTRVEDAATFVAALEREYDVILCDFNMPRFSPYAALQILFPLAQRANEWLRKPNAAPVFGGRSALERMLGGQVGDLFVVRQYLDAQRGGKA